MLPPEIEPFADHHIEELDKVRHTLLNLYNNSHEDSEFTPEVLKELESKLSNARQALIRFKICMADEVQQKDLYRTRWLSIRFPKQDR